MPVLETGVGGFSTFPSFSFFGLGSFASFATIKKSEIECSRE